MRIFVWVGLPLSGVCSSAVAEMQFSLFSIFRPWPKCSFCCFLSFGRGRNAVFVVFYLSAVGEALFLLFFIFRPWAKRGFSPFFDDSAHGIRSFSRFLMILSTEFAVFPVFLMKPVAGFAHPRARKRRNSHFLSIRGLGSVEILIFYPSEGSEA